MFYSIIFSASFVNLCIYRNSWWNRCRTFSTIWLAAVFNTFGALAIAAETYGLQGAVSLRVIQNVFGVVFALAFCVIFYWFMSKKKESEATVHAE